MKTITTPEGIARYCWLNKPDTKFEPEYGHYRTELLLTEEDWTSLKNKIKPLFDEAYQAECLKQGKKKLKQADSPFLIDEENNYVVKSKMKGGGRRKDNTEYKLTVARFDSQGQPMKDDTIIGGGSRIKLGLKVRFWHVAAHGFGMTLEPQGVQVIKLEALGNSETASSFGFSAEESGYQHGGETFEQALDQPAANDNEDVEETSKEEATLTADF
tara:strand:- start:3041 stop:3685 length:645 start_codon:yes stop_codon:yes gene_type:complete